MRSNYFPQPDTRERQTFVFEGANGLRHRPNLLCTTAYRKDIGWESNTHSHDCFEFMFVVSGTGEVTIDGKKSKFEAGDVVVYNSGCLHCESAAESAVTVYFVSYNDVNVKELPENCVISQDAPCVYRSGETYEAFKQCVDTINNEISQKRTLYAEIVLQTAQLLFLHLLRLIWTGQSVPKRSTQKNTLAQVLEYVNANYSRKLSLQEIADACHIDKYYLEHLFSKHQGMSLNRYVTNKRVNEAGRLLRETNMASKDIAEICGFGDANYFSYSFKKATGKTPREYRSNTKTPPTL